MGNTESGNTNLENGPSTKDNVSSKLNTIPECLYHHYTHQPNREALVFVSPDGPRTAVTFGELYEKAEILAKSFISLGVKKGEVVAVCLRSCPEWLYVTFGAMMAGAIPIGLSFTYADGSDVVAMMERLQICSAIVMDPAIDKQNWNIFTRLISNFDDDGHVTSSLMPYLRYLICRSKPKESDKALTVEDMITWNHSDINLPSLESEDIVCLFQTSGSTGFPKACAHTHRSIISSISNVFGSYVDHTTVMYSDRPFAWIGGFPINIVSGETRVTRSGFSDPPGDMVSFLFDVVRREKVTVSGALGPLFDSLLYRQDEAGDGWPIQLMASGGQPVPKRFANCIGKLGQKFMCGYGSTEALFCCTVALDDPSKFQEHCIGYPAKSVEMKIVDENGETVSANTKGEIYIKSPCLFKCYYNDPEKTRACLTEEGWYKTDDIGYVTEDGLFFCLGRKSEMIISGGMNVAPAILESVLAKYPGVEHATCVPVPDDVMYQVICACIVLEEGSDVTEQMLREYCEGFHNDKSGEFTVLPTYYIFMNDVPETYTGKTERKKLIKLATEKFAAA